MASYPPLTTVLDRLLAAGIPDHRARRHLRYGRVRVAGEVVTDPGAVVAGAVVLRDVGEVAR